MSTEEEVAPNPELDEILGGMSMPAQMEFHVAVARRETMIAQTQVVELTEQNETVLAELRNLNEVNEELKKQINILDNALVESQQQVRVSTPLEDASSVAEVPLLDTQALPPDIAMGLRGAEVVETPPAQGSLINFGDGRPSSLVMGDGEKG